VTRRCLFWEVEQRRLDSVRLLVRAREGCRCLAWWCGTVSARRWRQLGVQRWEVTRRVGRCTTSEKKTKMEWAIVVWARKKERNMVRPKEIQ
jgi:hypothetical protein